MKMTLEEAVKQGLLPADILALIPEKSWGKYEFSFSEEAIQDMTFHYRMLCAVRTGPISEEEVEQWQAVEKVLDGIDWEEARKRVKIETDFKPYKNDWEELGEEDDFN